MLRPKPIPDEQSRAILDQFYEIDDMANQISQHHYSKHDWQHM